MVARFILSFLALAFLIFLALEGAKYMMKDSNRLLHAVKVGIYALSVVGMTAIFLFFIVQLF